jgi:hypothetical protein
MGEREQEAMCIMSAVCKVYILANKLHSHSCIA